jgi:hypothetical protein
LIDLPWRFEVGKDVAEDELPDATWCSDKQDDWKKTHAASLQSQWVLRPLTGH